MIEQDIIRAAARLVGLKIVRFEGDQTRASGYAYLEEANPYTGSRTWSPWWDLGDATALALAARIMIIPHQHFIEAFHVGKVDRRKILSGDSPDIRRLAMCEAICRVAAELESMSHG